MMHWGELTGMAVELLHSLVSSLTILEQEGIDRAGVPSPRQHPGMLGWSVSPPFFLRAGIDLVHPRMTIPCSSCLHGSGSIRACSLSSDTLFARCTGTGCGGLHLFLHECLSLTRADLWPHRRRNSGQVQAHVELAFLGYNSMIVTPQLDPPCKLAQSLESDTSEHQELMLYVGHVLEWHLFFDSLPLILALPQMVEELGPQLLPICLRVGGVVVQVEGPEYMAQVLLPPLAPIVSDALQRVSGSPLSA